MFIMLCEKKKGLKDMVDQTFFVDNRIFKFKSFVPVQENVAAFGLVLCLLSKGFRWKT